MSRLDDVEREAVEEAVGPWSRDVAKLRVGLLALWSARGGVLSGAEVIALLAALKEPEPVDLVPYVAAGALLGRARVSGDDELKVSAAAVEAAAAATARPAAALAEARSRALAVVGTLDNLALVLGVVAPLTQSVSVMTGDVGFGVHRAANEATVDAARELDRDVTFVPERDACVECTGYAGLTGEDAVAVIPPVHPHCRCELQGYDDPEVPLALKREAIRSQLRGFSLPSESEAARLRAAKRVLDSGVQAPASVKRYARDAIDSGRFPRGRGIPDGSPLPAPVAKVKRPAAPAPKPVDVEGVDWRVMTNEQKQRTAEIMYGTGSKEHRAAKKKWP